MSSSLIYHEIIIPDFSNKVNAKKYLPHKTNQGEALYIINSKGIVYHQHKVLHLIKSQGIQPSADDIRLTAMIYTLKRDDIPSLRLG